jgi:hypothetical protein
MHDPNGDKEEGDVWDLPGIGNLEASGRQLLFRLTGDDVPVEFAATLTLKDVSKTLKNVERAAKWAGLDKDKLKEFMKAVDLKLPEVFRVIAGDNIAASSQETEKPVPPALKARAESEADRILNSADPLEAMNPWLDKMICGEQKNRKILCLKAAATRSKETSLKWILIESGEPGAGKTSLTKIIIRTCRCKVVGRLTRHALDYTELSGYDVLVLQEIGHVDKEDQGLSTIKFLSVDDNGYTVEVPIRDPETGEMTTKTYHIPPINVLTTSTRVTFDPQFERRAEILNPDESEEQTKAILEFRANSELEKTKVRLGVIEWTDEELAIQVLREVLTRLEHVCVEIAFPQVLNRVLRKTPIRTRGDIQKLYANIKLRALLDQRLHHKVQKGALRMVFASPDEAISTIELFRDSFEAMIGGIDKRTKKVVEAMDSLGFKARQRIGMDERMRLSTATGRSPDTIYRFMERLYVHNLVKKGKDGEVKNSPVFYELIFDPIEMGTSPLLSSEELAALSEEMVGAGHNFLKVFAPEDLKKIMGGWGRGSYELRKARKQANGAFLASDGSAKSFYRTIRAPFEENTSKPGKQPSVRSPSEEV